MSKDKTFDPNQVTVTLGAHIVTGYAADTFITLDLDEQRYNTENDGNGKSYRYRINNNNATITLSLNQGSPSNAVLSTFVNLDKQADSGGFPLLIKINGTDTKFTSLFAYVEKTPAIAFGTSGNNREWVIKATEMTFFDAGF